MGLMMGKLRLEVVQGLVRWRLKRSSAREVEVRVVLIAVISGSFEVEVRIMINPVIGRDAAQHSE